MPEIIGLCTRVVVMREGSIADVVEGSDVNEQTIMRAAAGLRRSSQEEVA
jgi:ribose transport system ATP-binding protein